jgi:hypothetical protein
LEGKIVNSQALFKQWWRIGGAFGIGFVILFIAGIVAQGDIPMRGDSIEEVRAYFQDDGDMYLVGDYLTGIAIVFLFLPYLVTLRWVLGSGEGWPPIWSWLTVVGGVTMVALGGAGSMTFGTLALSADNPEIDDSSVRLLMEMNSYAFTLFAFGMALFVGSASLVILRTGVIWRWLAGLGLLAALLLVIGAAWPIDGDEEGAIAILGFIGAPATMLFIIISSINMIIRSEEPAPTERASAT